VRREELIESPFILIRTYPRSVIDSRLATTELDDPREEGRVFEAWLSRLNESDGIATVSEGSNLRLLRVVDRAALDRAFDRFVPGHKWRPEFMAANESHWARADALIEPARSAAIKNLDFEGNYAVDLLSLARKKDELAVDVWWREVVHDKAHA